MANVAKPRNLQRAHSWAGVPKQPDRSLVPPQAKPKMSESHEGKRKWGLSDLAVLLLLSFGVGAAFESYHRGVAKLPEAPFSLLPSPPTPAPTLGPTADTFQPPAVLIVLREANSAQVIPTPVASTWATMLGC